MVGRHRLLDARRRSALGELIGKPEVRWIALGAVVGTHGLRGTLRVKQYNLDSELLFGLEEVASRREGQYRAHRVAEVQETAKGLLVRLHDVTSVEAASELRGSELCVPRELLPPLEPGEFYHVDLEGLAVVTPDGAPVGEAERVHAYPAADVLCVRCAEGVWEIPLREPYLVEVDLEARRIVVDELGDLELERPRPEK